MLEVPPEPPRLHVEPVTRDTRGDRKRHGDDTIAFGVVMHRILEAIAKAEVKPDDSDRIGEMAQRFFASEGIADDLCTRHCAEIQAQLEAMGRAGLLEIALPQPDSYAEMPFMLRREYVIYNGRIDRLIVRGEPNTKSAGEFTTKTPRRQEESNSDRNPNTKGTKDTKGTCSTPSPLKGTGEEKSGAVGGQRLAVGDPAEGRGEGESEAANGERSAVSESAGLVGVYDYKTFPVKESDIPSLVEEYRYQMTTYVAAAESLFPGRKARGYLLFTALPKMVEVG